MLTESRNKSADLITFKQLLIVYAGHKYVFCPSQISLIFNHHLMAQAKMSLSQAQNIIYIRKKLAVGSQIVTKVHHKVNKSIYNNISLYVATVNISKQAFP